MERKNLIFIGSSYGGVDALKTLVKSFPADFPASLFVVQHTAPSGPGLLPEILTKAGALPASFPVDHEKFALGHIYVAPPDRHLLVEKDRIRITYGPKENRSRPSIDALFRSAAHSHGSRVIGVILTGMLDDGTAGLWAIKFRGGTAVVQDPKDALAASMPTSALQNVDVDYCISLNEIGPLLVQIANTPAAEEGEHSMSERMKVEVGIAMENTAIDKGLLELFEPSNYTCPECQGVLLQVEEGGSYRFRCHTGHAYSANSLLREGKSSIEDALWASIRAMEERVLLLRQLAGKLRQQHQNGEAEGLLNNAKEAERQANQVRHILMDDKN